jgi:hypothetical protein
VREIEIADLGENGSPDGGRDRRLSDVQFCRQVKLVDFD